MIKLFLCFAGFWLLFFVIFGGAALTIKFISKNWSESHV